MMKLQHTYDKQNSIHEEIYAFLEEAERPFRVIMAGITYPDPSYRIERKKERNHIFVFEYVIAGRGHLEIDGIKYEVKADVRSLSSAFERVSLIISEKMKSPVRCMFDYDQVKMSAKTGNGEAKDICRIAGDGKGLEIGFNNRYLMDAMRYAPADTVKMELNTNISPPLP